MQGCIGAYHEVEPQFVCAFFFYWRTDQATTVHGHKIDHLRRDGFGGANKIAFVFPVFIVYYNDNLARTDIGDGFFYTIELNLVGHIGKTKALQEGYIRQRGKDNFE